MTGAVSPPIVRVLVHGVRLASDAEPGAVEAAVAARLGAAPDDLRAVRVTRKSLDARSRPPRFVLSVEVEVVRTGAVDAGLRRDPSVRELGAPWQPPAPVLAPLGRSPIVVGAGPAGLFAALALAERGYTPLLVERGKEVRARWQDVRAYWSRGVLDPESNVAFGEGGAGTFSDGKVYTRHSDPRNRLVLATLARVARAPDILTGARPHLGTNRLSRALLALRAELAAAGVTTRFSTRLTRLEVEDGRLRAAWLGDERHATDALFLAAGHSARDVHALLLAAGVRLEARPIAVGARVEHPQALIDAGRYGDAGLAAELGAASYDLAWHDRRGGLSAHSFCTCPGGEVVAASTEPDGLTVNGMSYSHRRQRWCNSALIVELAVPEGAADPLVMARWQRQLEQRAAAAGGGGQVAPAQRVADFLAGTASAGEWPSSYRLGIQGTDLAQVLPEPVTATLRRALRAFGRKIPGFDREGHLIAIEARTCSPVRVVRDPVTGESVSARGLFPIGEGAGHAGGIVSAAVDGVRAAERVAASR